MPTTEHSVVSRTVEIVTLTELTADDFLRILYKLWKVYVEMPYSRITALGRQEHTPHLHMPRPEQIKLSLSLEMGFE